MKIEKIQVTPDQARQWLAKNRNNRPVSRHLVNALARDIRAGHWRLTHQPIALDTAGNLLDGQHRLHAIILAEKAVPLLVATSDDATLMDYADRGRPRTIANQLKIQHHIPDANIVASLCACLANLGGNERLRLTVPQTLALYHHWKTDIEWAVAFRKKIQCRNIGLIAACAYARNKTRANVALRQQLEKIFENFAALASAPEVGAKAGCQSAAMPVAQLWAFIRSPEGKLVTRSLNRGIAELTLQAISMELQGKTGLLELKPDGLDYFSKLAGARTIAKEPAPMRPISPIRPLAANFEETSPAPERDPDSAEAIQLGRRLREPFSATDLQVMLGDDRPNRAWQWLALWKQKNWITTIAHALYKRQPAFGC